MSVDYDLLLGQLRLATKKLEEAQALEAQGGPRRIVWAADKRTIAKTFVWDVYDALKTDLDERNERALQKRQQHEHTL